MTVRTLLYVPADQPTKLAKSLTTGADAIIIDLEDAVALSRKNEARATAARWLRQIQPAAVDIWVRINSGPARQDDLAWILSITAVAGVCLAKCESPAEVEEIAGVLSANGRTIKLMPLIESARGVLAAPDIARVPSVAALQLGEIDLTADLGITPSTGTELDPYRAHIVLASSAAQIASPPAPVDIETGDPDRFRRDTQRLRNMGFWGRACIHPEQVIIANEVFTLTESELNDARLTLARLNAAGNGVTVDEQGRMLDAAVARHAVRALERNQTSQRNEGK